MKEKKETLDSAFVLAGQLLSEASDLKARVEKLLADSTERKTADDYCMDTIAKETLAVASGAKAKLLTMQRAKIADWSKGAADTICEEIDKTRDEVTGAIVIIQSLEVDCKAAVKRDKAKKGYHDLKVAKNYLQTGAGKIWL